MLATQPSEDLTLTPACSLGFIERLTHVVERIGIHKSGFVAFLAEATGLSLSGARRIMSDKRPPKRLSSFVALCDAIAAGLNAREKQNVTTQDIQKYLLEGASFEPQQTDAFDIGAFLTDDPVKTSQIIIHIEELAKQANISTSKISSASMRLIRYRIISYCFKNKADFNSDKVTALIASMFALAEQNLL